VVRVDDAVDRRGAEGKARDGCARLACRLEARERMQAAIEQPLLGDVDEFCVMGDAVEPRGQLARAPARGEPRKFRALRGDDGILDGEAGGRRIDDARSPRGRGSGSG
jgi:hypothetical protein